MNKIISINLKGIIFQVEEEAYDRLKQYLEQLNRHFSKDESRLEIIDDIESRIAEMMQDKLKAKGAVTMADVEEIIGIMGKPTDFETEDSENGEAANDEEPKSAYDNLYDDFAAKRFFRDSENGMLGGVCSGAAHYFGVDPLWVRLGFLFLFFVLGTGLLFYLILWVIIPEAKTQSDRLRMKGEKVNIDNIEKAVKEEYERVKKNFDEYRSGKAGKVGRAVHRSVGMAGDIAAGLLKFVSRVIGLGLFFWALTLFIVLVSIVVYLFLNGTLPLLSLAFENNGEFWLVASALLLLLLFTVMGLISAGLKLFNPGRKTFRNRAISYPVWALTISAIVVLAVMGIKFGRGFSSRQSVVETVVINEGDTLTVSAFNPVYYKLFGEYDAALSYSYKGHSNPFRFDFTYAHTSSNSILNDSLWHIARFELQHSQKDNWELEIIRTAYGNDNYIARVYAEKIPLDYTVKDGKLLINTHFYAGPNVPFRDQEITYRLWVPTGKVLKFEQGLTEIMDYGLKHRVTDTENYGLVWQMGDNGLKCLDCHKLDKTALPGDAQFYHFQDFTTVDIKIPADVVITEGAEYEIAVVAPKSVRGNIEIRKSGSTLKIGYDVGLFDIFEGFDVKDVQIHITMPRVRRIEASGATHVELKNITTNELDVKLHGACKLQGTISTESLNVEIDGSSTAELSGIAANVKTEITGASKLRASRLEAKTYTVDITGASSAEINATEKISGEVTGASHVRYKGKPTVDVDNNGASSTKPMD